MLCAEAHNEGYYTTSDNAGSRSKPRRDQSPRAFQASLMITRILCIGVYTILCDFSAFTSFSAYTRIKLVNAKSSNRIFGNRKLHNWHETQSIHEWFGETDL